MIRVDDGFGPLLQQVLDGHQDQEGYEVRHGIKWSCTCAESRVEKSLNSRIS